MASEDESDSSEENIFLVCNHCSEVFDEETEFNKHLTTYHPSDAPQLSCKTCGLGFKLRQNLMRHEKLNHNREAKGKTSKEITRKSYDCEICGAELTSGYILRQHMVTHTGEKKFKCRFCNSRFSFETNCKRHEARQHLQKDKRQQYTKKSQETFKCDVCWKEFKTRPSRNRHYILHTGDRPFKCRYCESKFRESSNCRRHELRQHEFVLITDDVDTSAVNKKPLNSNGCSSSGPNGDESGQMSESGTDKLLLKKRVEPTTSEMRFGCGYCDKTFKLPLSCLRHEIKIHNIPTTFE